MCLWISDPSQWSGKKLNWSCCFSSRPKLLHHLASLAAVVGGEGSGKYFLADFVTDAQRPWPYLVLEVAKSAWGERKRSAKDRVGL